jgi:hypothetical protein
MDLIDFILNIAAVLLWIDWRSGRVVARGPTRAGISIANSLRPTEKSRLRGWGSLGALILLLFVRSYFYAVLGSNSSWTPRIDLVAISIPWRTDLPLRMLAYSLLSFGCFLGIFYSWLLLLSVVHRGNGENDVVHRFVELQLGWLTKLPWVLKLILPLAGTGLAWAAISPLLRYWQMIPAPKNAAHVWEQAALFCVAGLLLWEWLLIAFFAIHLLNLYVYLGSHPFWRYVSQTASIFLLPLKWLRFGKIDISPLLGALLVFWISERVIAPFVFNAFQRLPL